MPGYEDPPRNKLYRNRADGMLAGVCAGFADYFGFDTGVTRVVVVIGALLFPTVILVYIILAVVLKPQPYESRPREPGERDLGRRVRADPHSSLDGARHRFRALDARVQRLEKYLTSERFRLDREFAGLKDS
jgi:phage shock protein C